jgi:tRNA(fMet)-specific endonuclease VapC
MSARFLLDTNICIDIRRRRPPEVLERFGKLKLGDAALSVVTYGELIYGAQKSARREEATLLLQELTTFLHILPLPADAAQHYGAIRASLERRGETIGGNDLWIAAHALSQDLVLVTDNAREFSRVDGLEVQNWAATL